MNQPIDVSRPSCLSYDFSRWPLVTVHIRCACPEAEVWGLYRTLENYMARGEPFYAVTVLANNGPTGTAHSRVPAQWLKTHGTEVNRLLLGSTIVVTNPILRGLSRAFLAFTRVLAGKVGFTATEDEAMERAYAALRAAYPDRSFGN